MVSSGCELETSNMVRLARYTVYGQAINTLIYEHDQDALSLRLNKLVICNTCNSSLQLLYQTCHL